MLQNPGYQTVGHSGTAGVHDMSKSLPPTHVAPQSSVQNQASSAQQQGLQMMYQNPQSQQPRAANPVSISDKSCAKMKKTSIQI